MRPSDDEIRGQLERLLGSAGFANADRMSEFLRFVVARALAGESDQVKEYVIGVEVFERNAEYDPRLDSIVRVEARRLRSKIDEYYAGPGREDAVLIRIPRGSYVPVFEAREVTAPPPAPAPVVEVAAPVPLLPHPPSPRRAWSLGIGVVGVMIAVLVLVAWRSGLWATDTSKPAVTVVVLPFAHYSADSGEALLAAALTDRVTSELARLGTVGVVSHTSALQFSEPRQALGDIARSLNADVVMEGSITRNGDTLHVSTRLVGASNDRKFWVQDFSGPANDVPGLARRIAAGIAAAAPARRPK